MVDSGLGFRGGTSMCGQTKPSRVALWTRTCVWVHHHIAGVPAFAAGWGVPIHPNCFWKHGIFGRWKFICPCPLALIALRLHLRRGANKSAAGQPQVIVRAVTGGSQPVAPLTIIGTLARLVALIHS